MRNQVSTPPLPPLAASQGTDHAQAMLMPAHGFACARFMYHRIRRLKEFPSAQADKNADYKVE